MESTINNIKNLKSENFEPSELVEDTQEDDYDEDDDFEGDKPDVQLGFIEIGKNKLFSEADWRKWDGGRVGGRPMWLNPSKIPLSSSTTCKNCNEPMKFLLQIYCPLDDPREAFHRTLLVFCCRKSQCVANGSIRCLRSQMSRANAFYVHDPELSLQLKISLPELTIAPLCTVCGCYAPLGCSICKQAEYCSKLHQKLDWKHHKLSCRRESLKDVDEIQTQVIATSEETWLFPEYNLIVEPEEYDEDEIDATTTVWDDAVTPGGKDEEDDAKLTQADYDKALGAETTDPVYIRFLTKVKGGGPDQVLRYSRWDNRPGGGPLAISSAFMKDNYQPQLCEHCGAARAFEFQIMPQLLHFLKIENKTVITPSAEAARLQNKEALDGDLFVNKFDEDIDWGTIDVYTCTSSCHNDEDVCKEEVVRIQPPFATLKPLNKEAASK